MSNGGVGTVNAIVILQPMLNAQATISKTNLAGHSVKSFLAHA